MSYHIVIFGVTSEVEGISYSIYFASLLGSLQDNMCVREAPGILRGKIYPLRFHLSMAHHFPTRIPPSSQSYSPFSIVYSLPLIYPIQYYLGDQPNINHTSILIILQITVLNFSSSSVSKLISLFCPITPLRPLDPYRIRHA